MLYPRTKEGFERLAKSPLRLGILAVVQNFYGLFCAGSFLIIAPFYLVGRKLGLTKNATKKREHRGTDS
jgi:hypothetical protein